MARQRIHHVCTDCGASHPQWSGRCSGCGEWNTLAESPALANAPAIGPAGAAAERIGDVDARSSTPCSTGLDELDRVLGGGLVPGSVTLLGGEPGIGKSTLLLQVLAAVPGRALYVTAEESAQQVRMRAERLTAVRDDLWLLADTVVDHVVAAIDEIRPELVVVDSIQTIHDPSLESAPGSVTQVRGCAQRLVGEAKRRDVAIVIVGHVTKDGSIAGPRVLEHVVDTVLAFEGERHHALRLVRAAKHRFGPTDELGLFEMAGHGLIGVPDPSVLFLGDRRPGVAGSAVTPVIDGRRPLVVEVQALASPALPNVPARRTTQGIDAGRLALLLAVLTQRAGIPAATHDVYASAVGGVRLGEPGSDLAACMAVASAITGIALPDDVVAFGEVGLGGEVRQVAHSPRRLVEAERLGFRRAVTPASTPATDRGVLALTRVSSLPEALAHVGIG